MLPVQFGDPLRNKVIQTPEIRLKLNQLSQTQPSPKPNVMIYSSYLLNSSAVHKADTVTMVKNQEFKTALKNNTTHTAKPTIQKLWNEMHMIASEISHLKPNSNA